MPYVEYNIVDSCNLKCKGCTHFANLCGDKKTSSYDTFCQDLIQVSKKAYVVQLRLLGGEPLLHPDLNLFVDKAREILPKADISIVTNGLLINKVSKELFYSMRKNNVGFYISRYIPTDGRIEKIINILEEENVDYFIEKDVIKEFGKSLDMKGTSNTQKAQKACISLGCRFLRNGRLYKCPFEGLIDIFADFYEYKNIPLIRGYDIYDGNIDWGKKLDELFYYPVEMCKYCAEKCEIFTWKVEANPKKEDWIVSN